MRFRHCAAANMPHVSSTAELHAIEVRFREMMRTINLLRREVFDLREEVDALRAQIARQTGETVEPVRRRVL